MPFRTPAPEEKEDRMRPSILVIEEDPDLGRLFEAMLHVEGYSVSIARSVHEARDLIMRREPDLIVFDWALNNAAGYLWIDEIRNTAHTAHIPVLLVCGAIPPRSIYEMLGIVGVPIVEKPFDLRDFCRHVAAMIQPRERAVGAF